MGKYWTYPTVYEIRKHKQRGDKKKERHKCETYFSALAHCTQWHILLECRYCGAILECSLYFHAFTKRNLNEEWGEGGWKGVRVGANINLSLWITCKQYNWFWIESGRGERGEKRPEKVKSGEKMWKEGVKERGRKGHRQNIEEEKRTYFQQIFSTFPNWIFIKYLPYRNYSVLLTNAKWVFGGGGGGCLMQIQLVTHTMYGV